MNKNVVKTDIICQNTKETKRVVMLLADLWDDQMLDRAKFESLLGYELRASLENLISNLKELDEHPEWFER